MLKQGHRVVPGIYKTLLERTSLPEYALKPYISWRRCLAADAEKSAEATQSDFADKEDFIDTPLPGVPEDVRKDPSHRWPHQTDKERKEDYDVPDEGETITKTPGYTPHNDPNAVPKNRRSYHSFAARGVRGLHSSSLFLGEKQPNEEDAHPEKHTTGKAEGTIAADSVIPKPAPADDVKVRKQSPDFLQEKNLFKDEVQAVPQQPNNPQHEGRMMHG